MTQEHEKQIEAYTKNRYPIDETHTEFGKEIVMYQRLAHNIGAAYGYSLAEAHYKETIDKLREGLGWVSVEDRLPEIAGEILVYFKNKAGRFVSASLYDNVKGFYTQCQYCMEQDYFPEVTHWMPLPSPPKQLLSETEPK